MKKYIKRFKAIMVSLLLLAAIYMAPISCINAYAAMSSNQSEDWAWQVLDIVNQRRAEAGLSPLTMDAQLMNTAKVRANEITTYFSHTRPNGEDCFSIFPDNQSYEGENIAAGYSSPEDVMNGWMNSPGHRANILRDGFSAIGIYVVHTDDAYGYYWVQCFGNNPEHPAVDPNGSQMTVSTDNDNRSWPIYTSQYRFEKDAKGDVRCWDYDHSKYVVNNFVCDGKYTYYIQLDGTAMRDRLTYHPDGQHVIYFNEDGHEVFSNFAHVKKAIAGNAVDDYCFFDVYGYMYVNVLTYDMTGSYLYYANPYGVLERDEWFQFDSNVKWANGVAAGDIAGRYGYAKPNGTLARDMWCYDWLGRTCYLQGNGTALY